MRLSYIVWAGWLALFLVLELLGFWQVFGWRTFSATVWRAESYPLVAPVVFATLVALIAHFLYHRPLLASVVFGLCVALGAHAADKSWPQFGRHFKEEPRMSLFKRKSSYPETPPQGKEMRQIVFAEEGSLLSVPAGVEVVFVAAGKPFPVVHWLQMTGTPEAAWRDGFFATLTEDEVNAQVRWVGNPNESGTSLANAWGRGAEFGERLKRVVDETYAKGSFGA